MRIEELRVAENSCHYRYRFPAAVLAIALALLTSACGGGGTPTPVILPQLTNIVVGPVSPSISVGATQAFVATGTYSDGSTKNLTISVAWTSVNTSVATISNAAGSQGVATAVTSGSSLITAAW